MVVECSLLRLEIAWTRCGKRGVTIQNKGKIINCSVHSGKYNLGEDFYD